MAIFFARIELHNHQPGDYDVLHKAMEGEGFSRTVVSDEGDRYHLPTAEYLITSPLSRADVLKKAQRAADKTKRKRGILVIESKGANFIDLDEVKVAPSPSGG